MMVVPRITDATTPDRLSSAAPARVREPLEDPPGTLTVQLRKDIIQQQYRRSLRVSQTY